MKYYPFMLVHMGVLSTSHGVSAVGSLLGKLFLIRTESECKPCSETVRFSSGYMILNSLHV